MGPGWSVSLAHIAVSRPTKLHLRARKSMDALDNGAACAQSAVPPSDLVKHTLAQDGQT